MLRDRGAQWCLLALLSPQRQRRLSQMLSNKGEPSFPVRPRVPSDFTITFQVICPPSPREHGYACQAPHQPHHRLLKLQSLSSAGCKNSLSSTHLVFPVNGFGEVFSCAIPRVLLSPSVSLSLLSVTRSSSPLRHLHCFSPPDHTSTTPTFRDVASSLPLVV